MLTIGKTRLEFGKNDTELAKIWQNLSFKMDGAIAPDVNDHLGVGVAAHTLGHTLADPGGHLLVHALTVLLRHRLAILVRRPGALLLLDGGALLLGHVAAHLLGHRVAVLVGHTALTLLGHVHAHVVGVGPAGAGDGHPHLGGALALPMVLAVLLVLGAALGLGVAVNHGVVLLPAHLLVHRAALLLVDGAALLARHVDAHRLVLGGALLHVDGVALLCLGLPVLGAPYRGQLGVTTVVVVVVGSAL